MKPINCPNCGKDIGKEMRIAVRSEMGNKSAADTKKKYGKNYSQYMREKGAKRKTWKKRKKLCSHNGL